jgi:hypothetical protein
VERISHFGGHRSRKTRKWVLWVRRLIPRIRNRSLWYTYSRAQAIADGLQIEVTKTAQEAGIRFPVFITRRVYEQCVAVPPSVTGQDEADNS